MSAVTPVQYNQVPQQGVQMQGQPMMMVPMAVPQMGPTDIAQCKNLLVKQTRKGCFQELFGCTADTEFLVSTMDQPQNNIIYATENTPCIIRFCCGAFRPFTINTNYGAAAGGPPLATFERPFNCLPGPTKCCCFQKIIARRSGSEQEIGRVQETFYCCVPQYAVKSKTGDLQYNIHMPVCCGGCCVDICAEGCFSCRIPFYIYPPGQHDTGTQVGKIVKVWGGIAKELFTDADTFELEFPETADADTKLTLMGGVFLLNQMYFEKTEQNGGVTL